MPITISLVEDNDSALKMIELTFDGYDVKIEISKAGEEAFSDIKRDIPDIVIADADMDGVDGFELVSRLKDDPDLSIIPFILLVNNDFDIDKDDRYKGNAEGIIYKPFKSDELLDMVSELTGVNLQEIETPEHYDTVNVMTEEKHNEKIESGVIKLTPEDEIEPPVEKDTFEHNEILPEDILEEKEKKIDFSDIVKEDTSSTLDDVDIFDAETFSRDESPEPDDKNGVEDTADNISHHLRSDKKQVMGDVSFKELAGDITEGVDRDLNKAVLNKLLGEQVQTVIDSILQDVTRDVLKKAIEKSVTQALENSFDKFSPRILKIIEDVAWEIIPDLSEVLIKKEIERLKSGI